MPTVAALKAELKSKRLPQTGEKPELEARLALHARALACAPPGEKHAFELSAPELRKALASRGLPCDLSIATKDELIGSLVQALEREARGGGGGGADSGGDGGGGDGGEGDDTSLAVELAKQVLLLGEGGDVEGVLSLTGARVSRRDARSMRAPVEIHPTHMRNSRRPEDAHASAGGLIRHTPKRRRQRVEM